MLLRSMLYTPGSNLRMIEKATTLPADAVILDLEDAVPMAEKETARRLVGDSIDALFGEGSALWVRVNALSTGLAAQDLEWVVQEGLLGILVPKAESKDDILEMVRLIDQQEKKKGIEPGGLALMPLLETARGVVNVHEIATASRRIIAIAFGAIDFARDMRINLSREGTELLYARSRVAIGARSAGVVAIDTPWIDVADQEGLTEDAKIAKQLGFRGKLVIHPSQIEAVNQVFSPTRAEIAYAEMVVTAFQEAERKGVGAISLGGRMIDSANYQQAQELLSVARTISGSLGRGCKGSE